MRWSQSFLGSLALVSTNTSLAFPNTPFKVSTRWILDSTGANFTYAGVNWPGAGEVMIPEGLQYASIQSIVSKIKNLGMNVVRLTFAIEMIDDVKDNEGDVTVQKAFTQALGSKGSAVYEKVVTNNPQFDASTTRLQVFDAVAGELLRQGIYVHLDNHISKAKWCCSSNDGNTWFGDTDFNIEKWKRGLQYMAEHTKTWPNIISLALRNELRKPPALHPSLPYTWQTWSTQMTSAATLIHAANPTLLIFLSGLDYDTTLSPIPAAADLGGGITFQKSRFAYADKLVLELHNYQTSATDCNSLKSGLWGAGFKALDASAVNQMPVVMTEFGFSQADGSFGKTYAMCLRKVLPEWRAGWVVWVLAGSYYVRAGTLDFEETWGLLNHDWSAWRRPEAIEALKQMVAASNL